MFERPDVSPSICRIDLQQQQRPAGLLLSAPGAKISIDRCGQRTAVKAGLSERMKKRVLTPLI